MKKLSIFLLGILVTLNISSQNPKEIINKCVKALGGEEAVKKFSDFKADGRGSIRLIDRISINSKNVNIRDVEIIETSYPGRIGMSGGPLINNETKEVIGLMSIGLPPDVVEKQTVAAISIFEILAVL